jgi:2-polyprenyl-6-methoxyphenol hydroxylase-like FAD-dependent oxidoreductase
VPGFSRLPSRFPFVLVTPQSQTERVLQRRAQSLGARIVRGCAVTAVKQDADGVELETAGTRRRARYVVGADGVHSAVRRSLGLGFPGRALVQSMMRADVRLREAPRDAITLRANADGFALLVPFGDGWYRLIAWDRRRESPEGTEVNFDALCDIARRVLGIDYGIHDPRWMSTFHSDERQVPRYRSGRVFLAGDAAHVHSPAGGMGMNTGLQDAANLSWKLAGAIHGWAAPGVLDSYDAERRHAGRITLRASGTLLRLMRARSLHARAGRALMSAAAGLPPLNRRLAGTVSGIDLNYGPAAGRAADIPLSGGMRLYERLRSGQFVLVGAPLPAAWADRVISADGTEPMLVRPDGYLAWSPNQPGHPRLHDALGTWLRSSLL